MELGALTQCAARNCWPAPAKLNLCLYVVGKRDDGYHQLETLFQLLDFGDELGFQVNDTGQISRTYDYGFSETEDLCLRAANLLKRTARSPHGVEISLHKNLPMGGGLGGGSSDAATVLLALNHLWDTQLSIEELSEIGLQLGADVPVFVRGHSAWGSGIGEQLTPVQLPPQKWLVVTPNVHVSTAQIFSQIRLTECPQMKKIRALKMALAQNRYDFAEFENQLEPNVRAAFPEVEALFDWFDSQPADVFAQTARMSGSGGTVFAPLLAVGDEVLTKLPAGSSGFIAHSVNTHPLLG